MHAHAMARVLPVKGMRMRSCSQRPSTLRAPLARGLCLGAYRRPQYIAAPSVVVHALMSLRSANLPVGWDHVHGDPAGPDVC